MTLLAQRYPCHRPATLRVWIAAPDSRRRLQLIQVVSAIGHEIADALFDATVILADSAVPESSLPVLALGMPGEDVDGSLPAGASHEQIDAGLRAIAAGLRVSPRDAVESGFGAIEESGILLTARETEVVTAAAQGMSNKEIARELGISLHTVKFHLESLTRKLHVHGRTEAVAKAIGLGLLQPVRI